MLLKKTDQMLTIFLSAISFCAKTTSLYRYKNSPATVLTPTKKLSVCSETSYCKNKYRLLQNVNEGFLWQHISLTLNKVFLFSFLFFLNQPNWPTFEVSAHKALTALNLRPDLVRELWACQSGCQCKSGIFVTAHDSTGTPREGGWSCFVVHW